MILKLWPRFMNVMRPVFARKTASERLYYRYTAQATINEARYIAIVAGGLWSTLPLLLGLFAVCVAFFYGTAYLLGGIMFLRNKLLGR